jgi:putative glycosyltransferase
VRLLIVSTLYTSAPYLEEFQRRTMAAAEQVSADIWLMARTGAVNLPLTGFRQVPFDVVTMPSPHARNYSVRARMKMMVDNMTAFSPDLLYYIYGGLSVFFLSFLWLAALVLMRIFIGHSLSDEGWTSLIVSVWMFGGLTVLLIGLIGIYVAHIFNETKGRPYVIVREITSSQQAPAGSITDAAAAERGKSVQHGAGAE